MPSMTPKREGGSGLGMGCNPCREDGCIASLSLDLSYVDFTKAPRRCYDGCTQLAEAVRWLARLRPLRENVARVLLFARGLQGHLFG